MELAETAAHQSAVTEFVDGLLGKDWARYYEDLSAEKARRKAKAADFAAKLDVHPQHVNVNTERDASHDSCSLNEASDSLPPEGITTFIHKHIRTAPGKSAKSC
jgi:hypothetical protein